MSYQNCATSTSSRRDLPQCVVENESKVTTGETGSSSSFAMRCVLEISPVFGPLFCSLLLLQGLLPLDAGGQCQKRQQQQPPWQHFRCLLLLLQRSCLEQSHFGCQEARRERREGGRGKKIVFFDFCEEQKEARSNRCQQKGTNERRREFVRVGEWGEERRERGTMSV